MTHPINGCKAPFFSKTQNLMHFRIGPELEDFFIHDDVLNHYHFSLAEAAYRDHVRFTTTLSLEYPQIQPCVFQGFVHWLYKQHFPSEALIKSDAYPKEWSLGPEESPVVLSMVIELYFLGCEFQMEALLQDTIAYIFHVYMTERKIPSMKRVNYIFENTAPEWDLPRFCIDIWYKWYARDTLTKPCFEWQFDNLSLLPQEFLLGMIRRHAKVNHDEGRWTMRLADYCNHTMSGGRCACRGLDPRLTYIIE